MSVSDIDTILCVLWTLTYALVLIGTEKYKYPVIPPAAQLIIASLEFSVVFRLLYIGTPWNDYAFLCYVSWAILEIAIIISQIRQGFIRRHYVVPYLIILIAVTLLMSYLVAYRGQHLFFALFNTLAGETIWLFQVRKKDYPMRPIVFMTFLTKFIADVMSVPVYFGVGSWAESLMGILIPTADFLFIHIYFSKIDNTEKPQQRIHLKNSESPQRGLVENEKEKLW